MRLVAIVLLLIVILLTIIVIRRTNLRNFNQVTKKIGLSLKETSSISENPFGVMFANTDKVKYASYLGVSYYRPNSVFIDKWNGGCEECDAAQRESLGLILTVRNNGGRGEPSNPPDDIIEYKRTLAEILDKYNPSLLVVENEENSQALFYTGTPNEYHNQLNAACEVAHERGIKCTNGGFVSSLVALLVADNYKEKGQMPEAVEYLKRALGTKLADFGVIRAENVFDIPRVKEQIERGKVLLSSYKVAGSDYINFHWYIADTDALEEAVRYLEEASGLPAITNEVGQQKNEDPNQVTSVMQKIVELDIPVAVWFSVDVPAFGGARSLINQNGNLRSNGVAFKNFIDNKFAQ